MRRKPFGQVPLTSVLREIADLHIGAFQSLHDAVRGPDAFDTDKDRVRDLAESMKSDSETVRLVLSALAYMYDEIHDLGLEMGKLPETINDLIINIQKEEEPEIDQRIDSSRQGVVVQRLTTLLKKQPSVERYRKAQRLRSGFIPAALGFSTFVDLRPSLSEDRNVLDELIPIIQFRIRTDSDIPDLRTFVFQLDTRSLRRLKEAIELTENKLEVVTNDARIASAIAKSGK